MPSHPLLRPPPPLALLIGLLGCEQPPEDAPADVPALPSELSIVVGDVTADDTLEISYWADGMEDCQTGTIPLASAGLRALAAAGNKTEVTVRKTGRVSSAPRPDSPGCLRDHLPTGAIESFTGAGTLDAEDTLSVDGLAEWPRNSTGVSHVDLIDNLSLGKVSTEDYVSDWLWSGPPLSVTVAVESPPPTDLAELGGSYRFGPGSRAIPVDPATGELDPSAAIDLENEVLTVTVTAEDGLRLESPSLGVLDVSVVLQGQFAAVQIPDQIYSGNLASPANPDRPESVRSRTALTFEKMEGEWGIGRSAWDLEIQETTFAGRKYELQVRCCPRTS